MSNEEQSCFLCHDAGDDFDWCRACGREAYPGAAMKDYKPILCIDFDGVLHSYSSGWKGAANIPDPPVEGAIEFLLEAMNDFEVAIFSSRSHQWGGRRAMKRWLKVSLLEWKGGRSWLDLPHYVQDYAAPPGYDEDEWPDMIVKKIRWPLFKPPALLTIDDRAICFSGSWPDLGDLRKFQPWNKRGREKVA